MSEFSPGSYTEEDKMPVLGDRLYTEASDLPFHIYEVVKEDGKRKGIPAKELIRVLHALRPERVSELPAVYSSAMYKELEAKYQPPKKELTNNSETSNFEGRHSVN